MNLDLDLAGFDSILRSSKTPMVFKFWSKRCGICPVMGRVIDALEKRFSGIVNFISIETGEDSPGGNEIARRYQIKSLPTVLLVNHGAVVMGWAGYSEQSFNDIQSALFKTLTEGGTN